LVDDWLELSLESERLNLTAIAVMIIDVFLFSLILPHLTEELRHFIRRNFAIFFNDKVRE